MISKCFHKFQMKKIHRKQEVTKMSNGAATSSEGDTKSLDDSKSNCDDSDDGNFLFSCELDSDGDDLDDEPGSDGKLKELTNPIDKLYNMQATYFAFT
ncbi:unnamed protein product [Anisakis simplex]|uniref:BESS domain-containing protein n=2 Tax=Anisakis simplex TaxID=6269 RepID=A0A0M3KEY3_ANISI|nr:unnamed protein product [Anisakis simplex]